MQHCEQRLEISVFSKDRAEERFLKKKFSPNVREMAECAVAAWSVAVQQTFVNETRLPPITGLTHVCVRLKSALLLVYTAIPRLRGPRPS